LALGVYVGVRFRHWDFDDAFIVYRYVANLREGQGWAFNAGEQWNASTSVLNPILILGTSLFVRSIPVSAHIVGVAAMVAGSVSVSLALLRRGYTMAALALPAAVLLLPPLLVSWGLETQLFLGLVLVILALEERARDTWLLTGLLVLVRPDGALFLVFKTARYLWTERRVPWPGITRAAAVVAPWAVYSLVQFGTLLPATLGNKRGQGASGQWGSGHIYLTGLRAAFLPMFSRPGVIVAIAVLAIVGIVAVAVRRQWWLGLLALFALTQQAAYAVLNPPYYHWYGVVFLFALCLFALVGVDFVISQLPGRFRSAMSVALLLLLSVGIARHWVPKPEDTQLRPREIAYQKVASYVRSEHPESRSISVTEAGLISFYVPLRMQVVDLLGLTSDNPPYYQGRGLDMFFAHPPDLALFHSGGPGQVWGFETPVFQDPRFAERYELEHVFRTDYYVDLPLFRLRDGRA
jgi:hypothetical protein